MNEDEHSFAQTPPVVGAEPTGNREPTPPVFTTPPTPDINDTPPKERHSSGSRSRHSSGAGNVRGIIIASVPNRSRDSSPSTGSPLTQATDPLHVRLSDSNNSLNTSAASGDGSPIVARHLPARVERQRYNSTGETFGDVGYGGARPKTNTRPRSATEWNDTSTSPSSGYRSRRLRRGSHDSDISFPSSRAQRESSLDRSGQKKLLLRVDQVEHETENVLSNFMYESYNEERLSSNAPTIPRSPTVLDEITVEPVSKSSEIGRMLAHIGDEVDTKYKQEFKNMGKLLNIQQNASDQMYSAFAGVCRRLFADGIMCWGRIVVLLRFGYHLAMEQLMSGAGDFMRQVIKFLCKFIALEKLKNVATQVTQSIAEWIASQGGWSRSVESMRDSTSSQVALTLCFVIPIALAAFYWWKKG